MLRYSFTVFLGAFLLFAVQLLLGKYFLPWFGGTPAMWTTCMLFFQILLLAGYLYAHVSATWLRHTRQAFFHFAVLSVAVMALVSCAIAWHEPLMPDLNWRPISTAHPMWAIAVLLAVSAGLPYFVLSTTGPLLQSWFSRTHPQQSPYRLYALSNLGSFLALLSYPFLVEPWLSLRTQARLWSFGFLAYAAGCAFCAMRVASSSSRENLSPPSQAGDAACEETKLRPADFALWLGLAACASTMFLATTNQICQDVAVVPLLWVMPLSLYLLSFVICFEKPGWYSRGLFHPLFAVGLFLVCFLISGGALTKIVPQIAIYSFNLSVCCMVCHGELARTKPGSRNLTSFYLMVALGGALGGIFVALIAPLIFPDFWELQVGLWTSALLLFVALRRDRDSWLYGSRFGLPAIALAAAILPGLVAWATLGNTSVGSWIPAVAVLIAVWMLAQKGKSGSDPARARAAPLYCAMALLVLAGVLFLSTETRMKSSAVVSRGFYGVLTVRELSADQPEWRAYSLSHGRVAHGFQFVAAAKRHIPTSYFGAGSGIGEAVTTLQERSAERAGGHSVRIGVAGLGVGTVAAYGRPGDYIRFYEINPEVIRIARDEQYFSFLKDSLARVDVVPGDARLSMESELSSDQPQRFDLLAIDAFSGDAPPVHLLTEQAFQIYLREIKNPDGVIAVNITNTYLDFRPVLSRIADHFGLASAWVHSEGDGKITSYNDWILLSRDEELIASLRSGETRSAGFDKQATLPLWTDEYSNLFRVLRSWR